MSTAPNNERSVLAGVSRILSTPVGELLRGRIGPRLTHQQIIERAGLPVALADTVSRVVRATRLSSREKVQVAHELVAHFQDGLTAGRSEIELRDSFGNAKLVARMIRRAKRRNRPVLWKLAHGLKRGIQIVLALLVLVYGVQAARLYRHSPKLTHNYVAEWNAPSLAVAEDERAWPIYRTAVLGQHGDVPVYEMSDLNPASPNWSALNTYIADNDSTLELCRRAAAMPRLGAVLDAKVDSDLLQALGIAQVGRSSAPASASDNPDFLAVQAPPQCAALRRVGRLLALDARIAAVGGDAQRTAADIDALHGVVDHAFQLRLLIGDLVGLAIGNLTCDAVRSILHSYPSLLSGAALKSLAHRLAVLGGGPELRLNFASEYAAFDDTLQRYYTDDGRGDGLPTAELMWTCRVGPGGFALRPPFGSETKAAAPVMSILLASRQEVNAQFRDWMARVESEAQVPLWERGPSEVEHALEQLHSSPLQKLRYYPISLLFPSYSRCAELFERTRQARDATLVATALELYRRQAGAWPESLNDLTPQFLPQVPPDRYDGKPLKYRVIDGQPVLYSIGVNRIDDGGRLPEPRKPNEKSVERNQRAREWLPVGTPGLPDGDWILWPPVEE
jgi:hypothetical protein